MFVAAHRESFGLEPICVVLKVSPSSVRSELSRPPSARAIKDEHIKTQISEIFEANYRVYGCRKIKAALVREHDLVVDKDRVMRLMRNLNILLRFLASQHPFRDEQDQEHGPNGDSTDHDDVGYHGGRVPCEVRSAPAVAEGDEAEHDSEE